MIITVYSTRWRLSFAVRVKKSLSNLSRPIVLTQWQGDLKNALPSWTMIDYDYDWIVMWQHLLNADGKCCDTAADDRNGSAVSLVMLTAALLLARQQQAGGEGVVWERPPMLGDAIGLRSRGTPNQPPTSSSTFISLIPKQFFQWLRCIQEEKMPFCRINSSYLHGGGGESPLALKKGLIFFSLKICLIRPPRQGGGGRGTPLTDLSDSSWPMTEVSELFLLKWPRKTKHCKKGPGGFVNR